MGPFPHDAAPPAISAANPMGTDGFEFVEYTAPDPQLLRDLFTRMGFPVIARHRRKNVTLHEADYTKYTKLAVWFGNEGTGISQTAVERSELCINIPMVGIIESLNLGTSSGIVLYEITKQRRIFQDKLRAKIAAKKASKRAV